MRRHLSMEPDAGAQARRDAAWMAYRDRLGRAWQTNRGAASDIERQRERWTHER